MMTHVDARPISLIFWCAALRDQGARLTPPPLPHTHTLKSCALCKIFYFLPANAIMYILCPRASYSCRPRNLCMSYLFISHMWNDASAVRNRVYDDLNHKAVIRAHNVYMIFVSARPLHVHHAT